MALFRVAGFRAVRVTSLWQPGQTRPTEAELGVLENVAEAASRNGVRVYVTVMHPGSRTTPLTDEARGEFAASAAALVRAVPGIRHVIVGNEPNLNRFWLPQFELDGTSAAPAGIPRAARPDLRRAESRLAGRARLRRRGLTARRRPRGRDTSHAFADQVHPGAGRRLPRQRPRPAGHGRALDPPVSRTTRANRRRLPIPTRPRSGSRTTASSSCSSAEAFDGTAQPGSKLPILYAEFGVESQIPAAKASLYTGDGAGRDAPGRRGDPGCLLRAGARARVLSADGRGDAASSSLVTNGCVPAGSRASTTSTARRRPAFRAYGSSRPLDGRLDRPLSRRRAHRPPESAPLRDASGRQARDLPRQPHAAISTAPTCCGSSGRRRTRRRW